MGRLPVCMCDARARGAHGVRGRAGCAGCTGCVGARDAQGVRGTWTVAVQGVHLRAAASYERRVRHAGQMHDNLNITLKCEDTFSFTQNASRNYSKFSFTALLSCLHCFADGQTHLCQIICQKDVYMTPKIAKTCRISDLEV